MFSKLSKYAKAAASPATCYRFSTQMTPSIKKLRTLIDLPEIVNSVIVFDIDETIFMPLTSFIYKVKSTDSFVSYIDKTFRRDEKQEIFKHMEDMYYDSNVFLLEDIKTREVVRKLRLNNLVIGMTARKMTASHRWEHVHPHLENLNVAFDEPIVPAGNVEFTNFKKGVFFAGGKNKGELAHQFTQYLKEIYISMKDLDNDLFSLREKYQLNETFDLDVSKTKEMVDSNGFEKIYLIDNHMQNCEDFSTFLAEKNIFHTAFHYVKYQNIIDHKEMLYQFADIVNKIHKKDENEVYDLDI